MQAQIPISILCLLVHAGIYLTSGHRDRRVRLLAGLLALVATWVLWLGGQYLAGWPGTVLLYAPYYLPLLSFGVYVRGRGRLPPP